MHTVPVDRTIRNAIGKTIAASLTAYIAVFGLQDKGHANMPPTEAAMKQEQVSNLEPITHHLFEAAVKPELTLDLELITDHPFEKEAIEEAGRTDYEVAKILAIEGSRRLGKETEIDGSYLLKKSLQKWEEVPKEKIKGIPASEYAATQYALAYFYVHSTLDAYFEEDNPYPNSLERLQKAKDLALDALENYTLAERTAEDTLSEETIEGLEAPAFNVLGLANEYLGNLERAKECYRNAVERDDLDEPKINLRTLGKDNDVFLK